MGITGLLPLVASVTRSTHLSEFKNLKVAVDAYVWLHRGAYGCSYELCQGIPTHKYLAYCIKMVQLLQSYGVIPVLVFDGNNLPSKKNTESGRRERREECRAKGLELMQKGERKAATECFQRAVDVTPRMAFNLIELLRKEGVEYMVAPYEADAQLTFLCLHGLVSAVISEDSDLIPYGCPRMLYKLDKDGYGKEVRFEDLGAATEVDLSRFSPEMLRHMCILSGCDYLDSLPGMGLKKAHGLVLRHGTMGEVFKALDTTKAPLADEYKLNFCRADLTFQHQIVYDPRTHKTVHLHPLPENVDSSTLPFAGDHLPDYIAQRIAEGHIDPHTHEAFVMSIPIPIPAPPNVERNGFSQHSPVQASLTQSGSQHTGTQPISQGSVATPKRTSLQWQSKAQTPLSAARESLASSSGGEIDIAKHDNDMTRDVRRFFMMRGAASTKGVSNVATNASSVIASASKKVNTITGYFQPSPKSQPPTSSSQASSQLSPNSLSNGPSPLFRSRLTSSSSSTPSKLPNTSAVVAPEPILRSRFFAHQSPPASSSTMDTRSPSDDLASVSAISWVDDDEYIIDDELEAIISGNAKPTPSSTVGKPTTVPVSSTSSSRPFYPDATIPIHMTQSSSKDTANSLFASNSAASASVVGTVTSAAPRYTIPLKAFESAFNGDSDEEEFEIQRMPSNVSSLSPLPDVVPARPAVEIPINSVPNGSDARPMVQNSNEPRKDRLLSADSVLIPIDDSSDSFLEVNPTPFDTKCLARTETSFTEPSLFADLMEFEASVHSNHSASHTRPTSRGASSSAHSSSPIPSDTETDMASSSKQRIATKLDFSRYAASAAPSDENDPLPRTASNMTTLAGMRSSSTGSNKSSSQSSRSSQGTSTRNTAKSPPSTPQGSTSPSSAKNQKKRKEPDLEDPTIPTLDTSPPLKIKKRGTEAKTSPADIWDLIDC